MGEGAPFEEPNSMISGLITVVIANYNRCDDLRAALRSVKVQEYPMIEVIVVDNGSKDHSRVMLSKDFPDVRIFALRENIGMDGYSLGFQYARGEFIFQMDNDSVIPDSYVLTEVVKRFQEGSRDLAVVATRVEEWREGEQMVNELRQRDERRGPINTGGFHSGGVGFRRSLLDQVGYYNRDVFLYGSELFLQMKFLAGGYRIYYYPEILMLHKSSPVARFPRGLYYEVRNRYWFFRRFANFGQNVRFLPQMVFHDLFYGLLKRAPRDLLRAWRDGLGPLPVSLQPTLHSSHPDFIAKIDQIGTQFSMVTLLGRAKEKFVDFWKRDEMIEQRRRMDAASPGNDRP